MSGLADGLPCFAGHPIWLSRCEEPRSPQGYGLAAGDRVRL